MRRTDILDRKEEILGWIKESRSNAEMCKLLGCQPGTLSRAFDKMGIDYRGNQGSRGRKVSTQYKTADKYLSENSYISSHRLKIKLIKDGVKQHRCEVCGGTEWMGVPIPIELDHIDGNHHNNELSNLRVICPNCHAQTDTNSGKNNKDRNKRV
jgi:Zn finger protein HypA/HybF involved in hydrogenase expression